MFQFQILYFFQLKIRPSVGINSYIAMHKTLTLVDGQVPRRKKEAYKRRGREILVSRDSCSPHSKLHDPQRDQTPRPADSIASLACSVHDTAVASLYSGISALPTPQYVKHQIFIDMLISYSALTIRLLTAVTFLGLPLYHSFTPPAPN